MRNDPFFNDTPRKTLDMAGESVEFPILYYDFRFMTAIFTTKTSGLQRLLPHPNFKAIDIWPGTGMLGITAFEYRDTSIGPYNEVAVSIPVRFPPGFTFPGFSAIPMMVKNVFHIYIRHLPVTTEIALKGGVHFWNYPKFMGEITFQDQNENLEIKLKEGDRFILKMRAKKLAAKRSRPFEFHTYSIKEETVMHAFVEGKATRLGSGMIGEIAEIELGEHPISNELAGLNLNKTALIGQYGEGAMSKLHEPDRRWDVESLDPVSSPF